MSRVRVAVVGAGPAGAYAAGQLLGHRARGVVVDVFERLPTPWGLLRAGVAPDHQEIKKLATTFDRILGQPGCRFFGGVDVGEAISHDELARHYHAVVYAVGARTDKSLGVPGEDLPGSVAATDFVGWYNGHPDGRDLAPDLSGRRAVIIGNGNVAADVARMLLRPADELAVTDIADHALAALRESAIKELVLVGRRGPAQAAFTSSELYDLGHLEGVDVVVDPAAVDVESEGSFTARRNLALLQEFAARRPTGAQRRLELRFLRSPVSVDGDGRVESVTLARTELHRDEEGMVRARATDATETLACDLLLRSVGYRAVPILGVPFDEQSYVIPNERGRVAPGVYAVGWIKRGATGILGTNKRDAEETVAALIEDLDAGRLPEPEAPGDLAVPEHVSLDGWLAIDGAERAAGTVAGRPRVKLTTIEGMLSAIR